MIINGQWVDEYNQKNWSYGPQGGQGLFNPNQQQVYWNQGTPSFQKPQTPTFNGMQTGPTQYGPTATGWLGGGLSQQGQNQASYNQLPSYGNTTSRPLGPAGNMFNLFDQSTGYSGSHADNQLLQSYQQRINSPDYDKIGLQGVTGTIPTPPTTSTNTTTTQPQSNTMQSLEQLLSQLNSPIGGGYNNTLTPNPAGGTQQFGSFNSLPTYGFYG